MRNFFFLFLLLLIFMSQRFLFYFFLNNLLAYKNYKFEYNILAKTFHHDKLLKRKHCSFIWFYWISACTFFILFFYKRGPKSKEKEN